MHHFGILNVTLGNLEGNFGTINATFRGLNTKSKLMKLQKKKEKRKKKKWKKKNLWKFIKVKCQFWRSNVRMWRLAFMKLTLGTTFFCQGRHCNSWLHCSVIASKFTNPQCSIFWAIHKNLCSPILELFMGPDRIRFVVLNIPRTGSYRFESHPYSKGLRCGSS